MWQHRRKKGDEIMLTYVKYAILHTGVKWMANMDQCGSIAAQDLAIIGYIYFV